MHTAVPTQTTTQPVELRRCLSALDLTLLGIGAIIGAGIFVITGIAAATQAGPGIVLSYVLAGIACIFCALSYAELASSVGGCGSAYGYAYAAGIGRLAAWIIGWNLLMEYGLNAVIIAIGWSGYVEHFLSAIGITLPTSLLTDPFHGGIANIPAIIIILALACLLSAGTKRGALFNNIIVYIKLAVIALFIVVGFTHINTNNWQPFLPFGTQGIVNGAGLIFFAFIGFDAVSTAGEEAKNPKRDLPIGILASLIACTVVYVIVAGILTGLMHYSTLNISSPVATALLNYGHHFTAEIVAIGAIAGLTTATLAFYYGFTRVYIAMSRDGFLPEQVAKVHLKSGTPRRLIWSAAIIMSIFAGFLPILQIASLVNIGTLAVFAAVCISVIVLRTTKPDMPRSFKTPCSPYFPLIGIALCFYLMTSLPVSTWISFALWSAAGIILYYSYSKAKNLSKGAK
jgi:APA family basic amino acid/polyamine antiporter